ncbi:MAG: hypothetical protein ACRYFX_05755 [Janthinobacterium lividum]
MTVHFQNEGGFTASFSIQWAGGETSKTAEISIRHSISLEHQLNAIPVNATCRARAHILVGSTHTSEDTFIYTPDGPDVTFTISGFIHTPSFSCDGCCPLADA